MQRDIQEATYPITPHPTWFFLDNSKMSEFLRCPRRYFYKYILGWRGEGVSIDLEFGKAWHLAQEQLRLYGYDNAALEAAYGAFLKHYRKYFSAATDLQNAPKNPKAAAEALSEYVEQYHQRDAETKTLYTEVSAVVPIAKDRDMVLRIDYIGKNKQLGIFGMDYKTGSRYGEMWLRKWSTDMQMKLYSHAVKVYFSDQTVFGMVVDGVILYKHQQKDCATKHRYVRVPLSFSDPMMNDWLFDVNHWYDMIEWNMRQLSNSSTDASTMQAFPKNPESCTSFNRLCPYHSFCCTWPNPLQRCAEPPPGMTAEWWDPRLDEDKPPKHEFKDGRRY